MQGYNAHDMARSFRTVRSNTIKVAEDIPEDQYGYRAAPELKSVGETLAHLAVATGFPKQVHSERITVATMDRFSVAMQEIMQQTAALKTKPQILDALRKNGEEFAAWLDSLPNDMLAETVQFAPPLQQPPKTRFEILLGVKEHEMHHRAQLMLVERMLGIVPHLTREREAFMAELQKKQAGASGA
ncbi:MAG TPA: DinB family protein [Bryobacteraceae bacterium]|nr:DinB family protein [Bryobacteraceae bacterium]